MSNVVPIDRFRKPPQNTPHTSGARDAPKPKVEQIIDRLIWANLFSFLMARAMDGVGVKDPELRDKVKKFEPEQLAWEMNRFDAELAEKDPKVGEFFHCIALELLARGVKPIKSIKEDPDFGGPKLA